MRNIFTIALALLMVQANAQTMTVSPNPLQSFVKVQIEDAKTGNFIITLFDLAGNAMLPAQTVDVSVTSTVTFDVSLLTKGYYFVELKSAETQRIIKMTKVVKEE